MIKQIEDDFFAPLDAKSRAQLHDLLLRIACHNDPRCAPGPRSRLTPDAPTFDDVLAARERISPYLRETRAQPLSRARRARRHRGAGSSTRTTCRSCNFKVRGGVNLVSQLSDEERRRGLVTASTGNHGQSIAFASQLFGVAP